MTALFSSRMDTALALAARAHRDQLRKGTDVPYIAHPFHVALLLQKAGAPEDVVLAGVLHDTLEDTQLKRAEIAQGVGEGVAVLVEELTQQGEDPAAGRTWRMARQAALEHLKGVSHDVALLKCADTLHNTSSLEQAVRAHGPEAWTRFKRGPEEQLWYYGEVARLCVEKLGAGHVLASELAATMDRLRALTGT